MNNFNIFVLPFAIGLYTFLIIFGVRAFEWIKHLPLYDRKLIVKGLFSKRFFYAINEVISESLLHRRIFRVNKVLGYMHMSIAFGWFLLIVGGAVESKLYSKSALNMPWEPIFLKFFEHNTPHPYSKYFNFFMDFFLVFVLSGVALAYFKRLYSRLFGMKKTTRLKLFDRIAMTSLWFIFPLRLLAESFTAGLYHNGGFLTNSLGGFLAANVIHVEYFEYTSWWLYSFAVGTFLFAMPYSRYIHIFTEVVLIFFRRFGIKTDKDYTTFSEIEVYSCPRCGVCIDKCQLAGDIDHVNSSSVYFISNIRANKVKADKAFDCLICGRCQEFCPVAINTNGLRITQRKNFISGDTNYTYLKLKEVKTSKIAYFAGCMSHLTPSIIKSMLKILDISGIDYTFIDETGGVCCGRPLMTLGNDEAAEKLIDFNKQQILKTKADILLTSCPICYRVFKEEYNIPLKVMHHSEFISDLIRTEKIKLAKRNVKAVYHDPCELGRGTKIYNEPREILNHAVELIKTPYDRENALCCGGSLGNIMLDNNEKKMLNKKAFQYYTKYNPDMLVTACPLCKKTFNRNADIPIKDIAEVVTMGLD